jgi:hypothetical protein
MIALDLMGAGEGLASQTILLRIRKIDTPRLKAALAADPCEKCGNRPAAPIWNAAVAPALAVVDQFPKLALDMALPIANKQLAGMGIEADLSASDAPPPARARGETAKAIVLGAALGIGVAIGARAIYNRFLRKGQSQ